ncbi:MAG TPA: hypothetical protein VMG58_11950 [Candidatus Sulfotelmatobacter sp.]|nr:hypothetical protein [Candidatus Sulfotelmatobacter sp.]
MGHLRLAARDEFEVTAPDRNDSAHAARAAWRTQIHQRVCSRCQRWFWAWAPTRDKCFICDPLAPDQLKRLLDSIHAPHGRASEASASSS